MKLYVQQCEPFTVSRERVDGGEQVDKSLHHELLNRKVSQADVEPRSRCLQAERFLTTMSNRVTKLATDLESIILVS